MKKLKGFLCCYELWKCEQQKAVAENHNLLMQTCVHLSTLVPPLMTMIFKKCCANDFLVQEIMAIRNVTFPASPWIPLPPTHSMIKSKQTRKAFGSLSLT